jgi:hypothetical protein
MLLTIHNLAKNYKLLPSEVLAKGTTFDLYILDTFSRYVKYQEARREGNHTLAQAQSKPRLTVEQMKKMAESAKTFVHPRDRKK